MSSHVHQGGRSPSGGRPDGDRGRHRRCRRRWPGCPDVADYGPLSTAARGKIDLGRARAHWPDLLRLVGSIHTPARSALTTDCGCRPTAATPPARPGTLRADPQTLHVLSYVDQAPYRAQIKGMRNLQEGRHDLARHVFQGRRGDLRRVYHEGREWRTSGGARTGPELHHTVEHRLPRRHPRPAARRGPPDARRGRRPALALHAPPPQRAGTTRSSSPISPVPAARCATQTPATTKTADRAADLPAPNC
jgi:hypothetical protein